MTSKESKRRNDDYIELRWDEFFSKDLGVWFRSNSFIKNDLSLMDVINGDEAMGRPVSLEERDF